MHIRSKRKSKSESNSKNIMRLILSVVFVFVILGFVYSLSNIAKNHKFNFNFSPRKSLVKNTDQGSAWVLDSTNLLTTKDGHQIFVQIASTTQDLADGLSFKDKLKYYERDEKMITEGMLFVFPQEMIQNFWMKDMTFDLDMIWLDSNYKIVHIEKNALATSYNSNNPQSSQMFTNGQDHPAKYVLEIDSGLSDKMNLWVGDTLRLQK